MSKVIADDLREWWAEDVSAGAIAERFGVCRESVYQAARRLGLPRRRNKMRWDEQNTTKLRTLWLKGVLVRDIAERLGTTRGAVIGKADRMGLPTHALKGSGGRR